MSRWLCFRDSDFDKIKNTLMKLLVEKLPTELIVLVVKKLGDCELAAILGGISGKKNDYLAGIVLTELRERGTIVSDEVFEAWFQSSSASMIRDVERLIEFNAQYNIKMYPRNIKLEFTMHSSDHLKQIESIVESLYGSDITYYVNLRLTDKCEEINWSNVTNRIYAIFGVKLHTLTIEIQVESFDFDHAFKGLNSMCFFAQRKHQGILITFFKGSYLEAKMLPRDILYLCLFNIVFKYSRKDKFVNLRSCSFTRVQNTQAFALNNRNTKFSLY